MLPASALRISGLQRKHVEYGGTVPFHAGGTIVARIGAASGSQSI